MGTVFSIAVTITILGFLWFFVARPILEDYGVLAPRAVKDYQLTAAFDPPVMSRQEVPEKPVSATMVSVPLPGTQLDTAEIAHYLTEDQIVEVLALARDAKGKHLYSGKKIYALVGGNYGQFLATMRELREDTGDMPDEPMVRTPIAGRPTKASYFDPELAYRPPD